MAAGSYIGGHTVVRPERWHCEPFTPLVTSSANTYKEKLSTNQYVRLSDVINQMRETELELVKEWNRQSRDASRGAYEYVYQDFENLGASDVRFILLASDWCFVQGLLKNYTPLIQMVTRSLGWWSGSRLKGGSRRQCLTSELMIDQLRHKLPGLAASKTPSEKWGCVLGIHRSHLIEGQRFYFETLFDHVKLSHGSLFKRSLRW